MTLTWSAYEFSMTIVASVSLVFGVCGMYLTIKVSPPAFGTYKYYLFNICFWILCFEIYMTAIYRPVILFPALVMCPSGFMRTNDITKAYVLFTFFLVFSGASIVSILTALIYRYAALTKKYGMAVLSYPVIALLGILHVVYSMPCTVFYLMGTSNRSAIEEAIHRDFPMISHEFDQQACAAVHMSVSKFTFVFMIAICLMYFVGFLSSIGVGTMSFKFLNSQKSIMHHVTFKLHRMLLKTLIVQTTVPAICLFVPFTMSAICATLELPVGRYVMKATITISALHSFFNTSMMICFIPAYQRWVAQKTGLKLWGRVSVIRSSDTVNGKSNHFPARHSKVNAMHQSDLNF